MRDFLKSSGRRLRTGWIWPLALLALPNCLLDSGAYEQTPEFEAGQLPRSSAVMCLIPEPVGEGDIPCATDQEIEEGFPLSAAAVMLAAGQHPDWALDYSQEALDACAGKPQKIEFFGTFPDGYPVCLNCKTQIPMVYANPTKVCIAQCKDLINFSEVPTPIGGVDAFCEAKARVAPNYDKNICYPNACSEGGTPLVNFADPRRIPEDVKWIDPIGTDDLGGSNSLIQNVPDTGTPADFNAGAASAQIINTGDAWVEFGAGETNLSHVLGVRKSCADPFDCPDDTPGLDQIGLLALSLNIDNNVYVIESNGTPDPIVHGPFGTYTPADRFRVRVTDQHDGTALIAFSKLLASCPPGTECVEDIFFFQDAGTGPQYPLRVDASFREEGAQLVNVTLMRILQ